MRTLANVGEPHRTFENFERTCVGIFVYIRLLANLPEPLRTSQNLAVKPTAPLRILQNLREPHSAQENLTDLEIISQHLTELHRFFFVNLVAANKYTKAFFEPLRIRWNYMELFRPLYNVKEPAEASSHLIHTRVIRSNLTEPHTHLSNPIEPHRTLRDPLKNLL